MNISPVLERTFFSSFVKSIHTFVHILPLLLSSFIFIIVVVAFAVLMLLIVANKHKYLYTYYFSFPLLFLFVCRKVNECMFVCKCFEIKKINKIETNNNKNKIRMKNLFPEIVL